jgi:uncharacterized membrane protein (UPF0127 family)
MFFRKHKKMIIFGIVLIVIALGVFLVWRLAFSGVNPGLPRGTITIGNNTFSAELATTMVQQAKGLSGRTGLGANDGMLFLFNRAAIQSFWMKDMNFPIDIIWIGSTPSTGLGQDTLIASGQTGKVLGFEQNAPTPKPGAQLWQLPIYSSPDGVDTVLEVSAGTVVGDNIAVGDVVTIQK